VCLVPSDLSFVRVGKAELRRLFNDNGFERRASSGALRLKIVRDSHPSAPAADEPFCTRSQIMAYLDARGRRRAVAHRYLRQDGTLGASGQPDPKALRIGVVVYFVDLTDMTR